MLSPSWRHSSKQESDINITPYIDILLVLLIIFMVIQPQARYDLKARVPQKAEPVRQDAPVILESIVVTIDRDGSLAINSQPATRANLAERLFEIFSARADKRLFVRSSGK
ncbi:MAG: ExbD/TolR family protein [Acidobacteriota bacterium]